MLCAGAWAPGLPTLQWAKTPEPLGALVSLQEQGLSLAGGYVR